MNLRRTLLDLVLAAAPLVASGCLYFDGDDDGDDCRDFHTTQLRVPEPPPEDLEMVLRACEADETQCVFLCTAALQRQGGGIAESCTVTHDATGHDLDIYYSTYTYNSGCPVDGRRPAGLQRARKPRAGLVGTHLARAAWFEAASVHAFVGLARELARHGASADLVRAAQSAAVDEIRHAQLMGALAKARGATPPPPEVATMAARTIESIALENAVEGLVGETWAALVATWQAAHAPDDVRATFAQIAEDETRHAELSRQVHAWAMSRLSQTACRRVEAARKRAIAKLGASIGTASPTLVRELGMPDAAAMQRLFTGARAHVWA